MFRAMAGVIPILDLADIDSSAPEAQKRAGAAVREGFGTYGLIYVRSHGIDMQTLAKFYGAFTEFVGWPEEKKSKFRGTDIWYQRGWTPANTEKAVIAGGQPDFKECFFIAPHEPEAVCKAQYPEIYADNLWPDLEGFRPSYLSVAEQLHGAGLRILEACAAAFDLSRRAFVDVVEGGPHVTRALRYLPLDESQIRANVLWGEEHTDFNLLTILPGGQFYDLSNEPCSRPDDHSGLSLRTRASAEHPRGELVRGKAPEGCIVAQVGQHLEILTGGELLATPHVITAPKVPGYSRNSMAHFIHAHPHQKLYPLAPFQTDEAVRAYSPPVLAGTYAIKTLVDIGLAPPEALGKLGYRHYNRLAATREQ